MAAAKKVGVRFVPETYIKRQVIQHGCLPSLLDDGDTKIEIVYGEEIHIFYWAD